MIALLLALALQAPPVNQAASERMEKKIAGILERSELPAGKRGGPVTLTIEEIDSFFAFSKVPKIPEGVSGIHFEIHPNKQIGYAVVDFDKYKAASKRPVNPMVDLFVRGRRPIKAEASLAFPSDGVGAYHLDYVSLDTLTVQSGMIQFLLKWFVLPRYPKAEMDKPFQLPANIRKVEIGEGKIIVYP